MLPAAAVAVAGTALVIILATPGPASATFAGRNGLIAVGDGDQTWVVRSDGTGLTRLPAPGEAAYSPDGRQLALADGSALSVADLNGASSRTLYRGPDRVCVCAPAWSPAADFVYFDGIFAVPATGGRVRRIA